MIPRWIKRLLPGRRSVSCRPGGPETVLVDDRERSAELLDELRASFPDLRIERLRIGDIIIGGRIAIERKTAADFAASIQNGRLERQLGAVAESEIRAVLILEGEFESSGAGGVSPDAIREAMLKIQLDYGVPLIRSRSPRDTAMWARALALHSVQEFSGAESKGLQPRADGSRPPAAAAPWRPAKLSRDQAEARARRDLLAAIPGVGPERARALIEKYGGLPGVFAASAADLMAVPGVGPALAQRIYQALHGQGAATAEPIQSTEEARAK